MTQVMGSTVTWWLDYLFDIWAIYNNENVTNSIKKLGKVDSQIWQILHKLPKDCQNS